MLTIPDLHLVTDYIPKTEEKYLLDYIDSAPWITDLQRRVQHYGYRYDYKRRTITSDMAVTGIPTWLSPVAERVYQEGWMETLPDQAIINEYLVGQGIAPHVDCEPCFGETIISLSLGAGCLMDFTHLHTGQKISVWLERRSLLVMHGIARYDWTHGIVGRKADVWNGQKIPRERRVSVTFRKVILTPS